MKYNFIKTNNLIADYTNKHKLDLSKYSNNYNFNIDEEAINNFYYKLLEYKDKTFLIVGDYDCDGICSVSIIKNLFNNMNIKHNYYIPSRLKEGYGLNKLIVDNAIKFKYDVLLLVDNGVSCKDVIDYAYDNNIEVFIIDHHKFEEKPRCVALLHQDLLSEEFKYCSAGELCFLLSLKSYFDEYNLVLGVLTILSDHIYINSFNKYLLSKAIFYLNNNNYEPIKLLNGSNEYDSDSLVFSVIPKINSISRLEENGLDSNLIVKYLLSEINVNETSIRIIDLNETRKSETNSLFDKIVGKSFDREYVLICSEDIKEGYCSSLATKLAVYYDKPVFVLNKTNGLCKGSCRCQNLNIHKLLSDYSNFVSFGGHEHACGLAIQTKNLNDFINFLDTLNFKDREETVEDVYIVDPSYIDDKLLNDINSLGPFGYGYEMPTIGVENINYPVKVFKDKYTKFIINNTVSAITFDEKYLGYVPKYIFGKLNKDNYYAGSYSIIIKGLI